MFSKSTWTTAKKGWSQFMGTTGSTARTKVYFLVHRWVSPPEFLGIWCWVPQFLQRHFCPWMTAKLLCVWVGMGWVWGEGYKWAMSFSAILLTGCFLGSSERNYLHLEKHHSYSFIQISVHSSIQPPPIHLDPSILSFSTYLLNIYNVSICVLWHRFNVRDYQFSDEYS